MNKHAIAVEKLKPVIIALIIAAVIAGITVVASSAENKNTVLVNFQVDAENTGEHLFKVLGELEDRGYTTTVYVTGSFAEKNGRKIQEIQERGHDIAFHGWATGENLATMNYSMQQELLTRAKDSVENFSGKIEGFRPQYYSQNNDTYDILDSLNVYYDSGFISGLKFIPGYENYSKPYKVPNHNFYAVPVSSYRTPDKIIYLCDLSASSKFKLNASEWSYILNNEFDENKKNNEPMVVVIHPWITGNETTGYWQVFTQFLDRIENKNIDVVKTSELLEFYVENDEEPGSDNSGNEIMVIFGMPDLDVRKKYTYNTTFDFFVEGRNGKDAVLYWGDKTEIDGSSYYVFNLTKAGGGEIQYTGIDAVNQNVLMKGVKDYTSTITFMDLKFNPETLVIDYPLWVGKTWERIPSDFSGTVWMGGPVFINGNTWGNAKVISKEKISVPAGIASTMVLETYMNSSMNRNGIEMWMNTSQKIWMMENGFFAKRQLYHNGRFEEELELKEPILIDIDIEKKHLKENAETFEVSIKLPEKYDPSDVDLNSIKCNGVPSTKVKMEDGEIKARFKSADFENSMEGSFLTVTGEFNDGTLFEGFEKV